MTITHHPEGSTLMSFAAGSLGEALGAVVASHLDLCAACRRAVRQMEQLGGVLMERLADDRARMIDVPAPSVGKQLALQEARPAVPGLPRALSRLVDRPLDQLDWRGLAPGIRQFRLPLSAGTEGTLRLLRVEPGRALPEHGHSGTELTLVLAGAYRDELGRFARGDVADVDAETEHRPVVEMDGVCICLVASERPLRLKGLARLLQPFAGI